MTANAIISEWKKQVYKPLYWLEGEEEYFIDKVMNYAEEHILNESETGFNLTVFYGKDADWAAVTNACRRYPMFAERQVVLLKEAQQMRDIEKLEVYIENPLGIILTTKKLYDNQLPEWTEELVHSKELAISQKALLLLVDHIGNDLSRIENEIDKISINLDKRKTITEGDVEQYVGVSKDFNVFELQAALATKNLAKAIQIIQYFEANPKAAPIQLILPSLYSFFSKVFMIYGLNTRDEKTIASSLGVNPFFIKDYIKATNIYTYPDVEKLILLLSDYNLKSIGINNSGTPDASLLKEMVVKMIA
jgi:DNA polymerase-3 subunit delta